MLVYDNICTKIHVKPMADVGHHMITKSVFYTPALTEKKAQENFDMLVMTKKKFKFDRLC